MTAQQPPMLRHTTDTIVAVVIHYEKNKMQHLKYMSTQPPSSVYFVYLLSGEALRQRELGALLHHVARVADLKASMF